MDRKKKKRTSPLMLVLVIAGVVLIVGGILRATGVIGGDDSTEVTTEAASFRTVVEKVNASGNIQPVEEVKISPEVSGEIKEITVEEGDSVVKGQLLVRIRPDNLQSIYERTVASLKTQKANLAQAESRLAQSKAQLIQQEQFYNRQKKLFAEKVISQQDYETAKANYEVAKEDVSAAEKSVEAARYTIESARASVNEALENLNLTKVYAPMDGIITKLDVEVGEAVVGTQQMQGTEMLRIANLNQMEVRVDVNENDIIRISKDDEVIIEVDAYAYQEEQFVGKVTSIANSANTSPAGSEGVTEFEVKILIDRASYKHLISDEQINPFRPGMTASVEIITEKKENVLTVPLSAVTVRKESDFEADSLNSEKKVSFSDIKEGKEDELVEVVFLYDEGKAKIKEVKTGINGIDYIEVVSGLSEGDKVISGPYIEVSKRLDDGDRVKSKDEKKDD